MLARKIRISRYSFSCRPVQYQRPHYITRFSSTSTAHARSRVLADDTPAATTKWTTTKSVQREDRHRPSAQHPSTRTAHIRFWEPVCSVVDVWVVKRALEKRFGAILETHFLKDFEVYDKYQMMAFVVFRDTEALERIPEFGQEFTIIAPGIPSKKPIHEISLNDLEEYARSEEYQEGFEFDKPEPKTVKRVIGGNIRRSTSEFCASSNDHFPFQRTSLRTMEYFLKWGGFSNAQFDMSERVIATDLFKPNAREQHTRMKAALQICSRNTSLPIPQRVVSDDATTDAGQFGSLTEQTARVFAGLYDNVHAPAIGRPNKGAKAEEEESAITNSVDQDPAPRSTIASSSTLEPSIDVSYKTEKADTSKAPSDVNSSSPTPAPQLIKRHTITAEEKQRLQSQMNAARLLQKTTTPMRRRQPKPPIVGLPKKPKANLLNLDEVVAEDKLPEKKGILAKIKSLFGS